MISYPKKFKVPGPGDKSISRCYFPKNVQIISVQLHGFSDASENVYSGIVYLRAIYSLNHVHVSLVMSKTKVSPIKRLSIPRLELCGAQILARLLIHVKDVLQLPMSHVFAWTDSTIVLNWLSGNPRRFKTYVGNCVFSIVDQIPLDRWNHVVRIENPAECASRGIFPLNYWSISYGGRGLLGSSWTLIIGIIRTLQLKQ